jgi:hypothetical protein
MPAIPYSFGPIKTRFSLVRFNVGGVPTDVSSFNPLPVAVITGGAAGGSISATYNATLPTYADGDPASLQTDSRGRLIVNPNLTRGAGAADADTLRVSIDSNQTDGSNYETVAASASDQVMGATGALGDFLAGVLIVPASTSPGAVSIKDGAGAAITIFAGGANSVSNLAPIFVPLGITSVAGAWKITTGTSVSAIGSGRFT